MAKCEICMTDVEILFSLCEKCSNQVEDWVEETDSYKRKDGNGYYQFSSSTGVYQWRQILIR